MTKENELTPLENVFVRRRLMEVQVALDVALNTYFDVQDGSITTQQIKKYVESYASSLQKQSSSILVGQAKEVYHGWKELYPTISSRALAFLFYKVMKCQYYGEQHWFHTVFPFKIEYEVYSFEHFYNQYKEYDEALTKEENLANARKLFIEEQLGAHYYAELAVPYTQVELPISVTLTKPVKNIKFSCIITRGCNVRRTE